MEFSRPEYWSGQPFPSPEDLPNPGIKPRSPALQADSLPSEPQGKPKKYKNQILKRKKYSTFHFRQSWFRVSMGRWNWKMAQLCPTLCDPIDHAVHGILQARILEWAAFPFSRESSQPRDQTQSPSLQADSSPGVNYSKSALSAYWVFTPFPLQCLQWWRVLGKQPMGSDHLRARSGPVLTEWPWATEECYSVKVVPPTASVHACMPVDSLQPYGL